MLLGERHAPHGGQELRHLRKFGFGRSFSHRIGAKTLKRAKANPRRMAWKNEVGTMQKGET